MSASRMFTILALVACAAVARADGPSSPAPGRTLARADLPSLVEALGYDARPGEEGAVSFVVERDGWRVEVNLALTTEASKLLVFAPLRTWSSIDGVPDRVLRGLLEATTSFAPSRFYVSQTKPGGSAVVGLLRSVDNRAVRAKHVREQVDAVVAHARATEELWNPDRWTGAPPSAPNPPR